MIEVEAASPPTELQLPTPIDKLSTLSMDATIDTDEQFQPKDRSAKTDSQSSQKQLDVHGDDQLEQNATTPKAATVHLAPISNALMNEPEQTFALSGMTATTEFR